MATVDKRRRVLVTPSGNVAAAITGNGAFPSAGPAARSSPQAMSEPEQAIYCDRCQRTEPEAAFRKGPRDVGSGQPHDYLPPTIPTLIHRRCGRIVYLPGAEREEEEA